MSKILITGAASGLGLAIATALTNAGHFVVGLDMRPHSPFVLYTDVRCPSPSDIHRYCAGELDVLINCAGINLTGWLEDFDENEWDQVMSVNAKGIFMMAKACMRMLKESNGTILNIVSNASHMPMTCSNAYNASKGAAHIMTLQMARELTKAHGITVFGISPNKLAGTGMSLDIERQVVRDRGWTPEKAAQYQLSSILAGEETDPAQLADFVAYLLQSKAHHKFLTGCILPYGA